MKHLVTYDISDDRKRNRVIKVLHEYGTRVQFSCFEIEISSKDLGKLIQKLEGIIDCETDKVFIFPISRYASPYVKKLGKSDTGSGMVL